MPGRECLGHVTVPSSTLALLDAGLLGAFGAEALGERPRERLVAATRERGVGSLELDGLVAIAVSDLPCETPLAVQAERSGHGRAPRWARVSLEVRPDARIDRSEVIARMRPGRSRFVLGDLGALADWHQEQPLDGLADFVFWGRDARAAADRSQATALGEGEFGWRDVPIDQAVDLGTAVELDRDGRHLSLATDFRPHSHAYWADSQIVSTPLRSASLELGGARICAFETARAEAGFEVLRELDARGRLARLTLELQRV